MWEVSAYARLCFFSLDIISPFLGLSLHTHTHTSVHDSKVGFVSSTQCYWKCMLMLTQVSMNFNFYIYIGLCLLWLLDNNMLHFVKFGIFSKYIYWWIYHAGIFIFVHNSWIHGQSNYYWCRCFWWLALYIWF
jgi:hypothetical protein